MAEPVVKKVSLKSILVSRYQTRKDFNETGIKALAESIKANGLEEPLKVREVPVPATLPEGIELFEGKLYELIGGERRLRACGMAGLSMVDVLVMTFDSEKQAKTACMIDNLKQNLNFWEEAADYKQLKDDGMSQEEIAVAAEKAPSYISESLNILELPASIIEKFCGQNFSRTHAVELTRLPNAELQEKAFNIIISKNLTRDATRKLVDTMLADPSKTAEEAHKAQVARPKGVKCTKSGKGIKIEAYFPEDTPDDVITKAVLDARQKFREEQNQPKPPKPNLKAQKKEAAAKIATVQKLLKSAQAHISNLKKAGKDTSACLKEISDLKAELQALHPASKSGSKKNEIASPPVRKDNTETVIAGPAPSMPAEEAGAGKQSPRTDNGAAAEVEEQKRKMLELINSGRMSPADMASIKAQYETFIPQTQQELLKPGIDEAKSRLSQSMDTDDAGSN